MSLPDEEFPLAAFVQEEMVEGISQSMSQLLDVAPPIVRLRLLAFMHLIEHPETMKATLVVQPSGLMRLTLDTVVAPCRTHQH